MSRTCVTGVLVLLALLGTERGTAATYWTASEPAADVRGLPPVVREIVPLESIRPGIERLGREMANEPTTSANVKDRLQLLVAYYDALQAEGILLNWRINTELNTLTQTLQGSTDTARDPHSDRQIPYAAIAAHRLKELSRADLLAGKTGRLRLESPAIPVLRARRYATVRLVYEVDTPLREGARIRIGQNWYSDLGRLQFERSLDANYATAEANRSEVKLLTGNRSWYGNGFTGLSGGNTPHLVLQGGTLDKGDKIEFTLGDKTEGSPGWMIQSFTSDAMELKIEIDFLGDGVFVPVAQPRFSVVGDKPDHIRAVAPSIVAPGEAFTVRASVEDEYTNRASEPPARLFLYREGELIASTSAIDSDPAVFHFEDIRLPSMPDQPAYLEVKDRRGKLHGISNPIVQRETDDRLYWGEMHGHEGYTDANGSPEWYMNYAKNVSFLDFAALTGHDLMLSEVHFRDIFRSSDRYHAPEQGFVSLRAYEWTNGWQLGGHHNVFMLDDQRVVSVMQAPNLAEMFRLQKKWNDPSKVLIIPHAHAPGDWDTRGLAELVEIYSQHGSFEWFGRGYLERGHRIGFNAAGDDHLGHPGNSPSRARSRGGLAGVFAPELSRESLLGNLKQRRTYGTSSARIYLESSIAGAAMGDVLKVNDGTQPLRLTGFTAGTGPLAEIAVVMDGNETISRRFDSPVDDLKTGKAVLRFRLTRNSEPDNPLAPRTPAADRRYWGRVVLGSLNPLDHPLGFSDAGQGLTTIESVRPLGVEHYGDYQDQTGRREGAFSWRVRGDYDGMLLDLMDVNPEEMVSVVIYTSPVADLEYWNTQEQPRLPGEYWNVDVPRQEVVLRRSVRLGDLVQGSWTVEFDGTAQADLALVNDKAPWYSEFSFDLSQEQAIVKGDARYVYVRVRQLDDETAWSSPIFLDREE